MHHKLNIWDLYSTFFGASPDLSTGRHPPHIQPPRRLDIGPSRLLDPPCA